MQQSSQKQLAETAFSDLNSLMAKAEEIVNLMERYTSAKSKVSVVLHSLFSSY
jgi:hypothetical protein